MSEYYLICSPKTKTVVRKSHKPASLSEHDLISLRVNKSTWKTFQAGDLMTASDLTPTEYEKWMDAVK